LNKFHYTPPFIYPSATFWSCTTRVRRSQSNGFVERLHRSTLLDEHFCLQGRKKWNETVEQMQANLDAYLSLQYGTDPPEP